MNEHKHNDDGTTHVFIETTNKYSPGKHTAIIDTADWERAKEHRWFIHMSAVSSTPYVFTHIPHPDGGRTKTGRNKRKTGLMMHHLVLGKKPEKGMITDHINRNGLDNRKENLRFVTHSQNGANTKARKNSSSQYLGVAWNSAREQWVVMCQHEGKKHWGGRFKCEHQAALAYNKKAKELHGEFANLNVVPQEYLAEVNNANP